MLRFGPEQREAFRRSVRARGVDDAWCVRTAGDLSRRWLRGWRCGPAWFDASEALAYKLAGYNAELHAHVIRLARASGAAGEMLGGQDGVRFELPDMLLGEYFLIGCARAMGLRVVVDGDERAMVEGLLAQGVACCDRPGQERVEVDLTGTAPCGEPGRGGELRVLFVASMNNYLNPMIPVMRALVERGERVGVLMPRVAAGWANASRIPGGVEIIWLESCVGAQTRALMDESRAAARAWVERPETRESFVVDGVSLWELVRRDIRHAAEWYVPHAAAYATIGERVIRERGVGSVVAARLRRAVELSVAQGASRAGAGVHLLIHGHVSERETRRFDDGDFTRATSVCVWGEQQRRVILAKEPGIGRGVVRVTGNPDWDGLGGGAADRAAVRGRIAATLGIDPAKAWITLTTQEESRVQYGAIVRSVLSEPGCVLIVKTHPREDPRWYEAAVPPGASGRCRVVSSVPGGLRELLGASDAVVTLHSTTNLESLLAGTPVITAALGALVTVDRLVNLEEYGLALATDEGALGRLVREVAEDPAAFRLRSRGAMTRALGALVANSRPGVCATDLVCEAVLGGSGERTKVAGAA